MSEAQSFRQLYQEWVSSPESRLTEAQRLQLFRSLLVDLAQEERGADSDPVLADWAEEFLLDEGPRLRRQLAEERPEESEGLDLLAELERLLESLEEVLSPEREAVSQADLGDARAQFRWLSEVVSPAMGESSRELGSGLLRGWRGTGVVALLSLILGLGVLPSFPGHLPSSLIFTPRLPAPAIESWLGVEGELASAPRGGLRTETREGRKTSTDLLRGARARFLEGLLLQRSGRYPEAVTCFREAAEAGLAPAQNSLGVMVYFGRGVPRDITAGVRWMERAARQGNPRAQRNLGWFHRDIREDREQALYWYRQAADQGDSESQFQIGAMLCRGAGPGQDCADAAGWYRRAAEAGHVRAMNDLSALYFDGLGVARDLSKGLAWLQRAAELGDPTAQYNLGKCSLHGLGVDKDLDQALHWFHRAANQNDPEALFQLGELTSQGIGGKPDLDRAREWYHQAAAEGHLFAPERLRALGGD